MEIEARVYARLHWDKALTGAKIDLTRPAQGVDRPDRDRPRRQGPRQGRRADHRHGRRHRGRRPPDGRDRHAGAGPEA